MNLLSVRQVERFAAKGNFHVVCAIPDGTDDVLTQQQVMLNEQYAAYGIWAEEEYLSRVGGRNEKLRNGWEYELLIRLAGQCDIGCIREPRLAGQQMAASDFYTDAYVLSRYAGSLKDWGYFDVFLQSCVEAAALSADSDAMAYLEDMLGKKKRYWYLYRQTQPFLILLGQNFCYNILNCMAKTLAVGLQSCGKQVELLEVTEEQKDRLAGLAGRCYQAVIGFQSFLPTLYFKETGRYFTDLINAPKLEMVFDHPFWFCNELESHGADVYVLTHDKNYVSFVKQYEPSVSGCFLLPPAGNAEIAQELPRDLDVVFLGTYNNYRDIITNLYLSNKEIRHMAANYIKFLREHTDWPAEKAFSHMLAERGLCVQGEAFARMMFQMGNVCQCVMYYYRENIIKKILDAGISVHVYGASWGESPFAKSKYLIQHPELPAGQSGAVLGRAKISLNVLAWHKGGCNERLLNSMFAGAAALTDKSTFICEQFADGRELCCYDLNDLESLPKLIGYLLTQEEDRQRIAEQGQKKVQNEYSARAQAERILHIVRGI